MTDASTAEGAAASLYRRFRPGRFAELRGQDHVVRALRGAVLNGRTAHAYLFSGPRGTGKTTTARILAKALNCENSTDGDACDVCASCVSITRGTSLDVIELDAASNNKVEDIREIIAGAWHGTPGRKKVYILDEVHMLSASAEAAFLKTLEEPPAHVIFVLATTDPHKVVATIRSRTQHLEFRLFSADTLSGLLHDVRSAAGLQIDDETLATAVRMGRGSARDALSALDQVLATGSIGDAVPAFDQLLGSLAANDAVETLSALSELARAGWEVEQLAESLAGELRQVFLLQVAPDVADALDVDRDRLSEWGRQLGLARTVRILETVGRTLREMKGSPVPSVLLEVALVRLARPELDDAVSALEDRLSRVERALAQGALAPVATPAAPRPIGQPRRAEATSTTDSTPRSAPVVQAPAPEDTAQPGETGEFSSPQSEGSSSDSTLPPFEELVARFDGRVLPKLSRAAQGLLANARLDSLQGSLLTIAVASESLRATTDRIQSGLRSALEHEFRLPVQIAWIVDSTIDSNAPVTTATAVPDEPEGSDSMGDVEIAESETIEADSVAAMLIAEAFPGAEEIG